MSFRSEVREFMKNMEMERSMTKTIVAQLNKTIKLLTKQNKDLMNRMMAIDFKELQTFSNDVIEGPSYRNDEVTMDFDEDNAGEILTEEELGGGR